MLKEAGYGPEHVIRCGVWLDDPRDFQSFNKVFREYFGANPPARACVVSSMVVDCKVEIECGDGSTRILGPGDALLADDTTGQGHISRDLEGPRRSVWIGLPAAS